MYGASQFKYMLAKRTVDGLGGYEVDLVDTGKRLLGYLDLMSGTNKSMGSHNAVIEQSTHVLIVPDFRNDLSDDGYIVDESGRVYSITFIDNPVGVNHHLEIFLELEKEG